MENKAGTAVKLSGLELARQLEYIRSIREQNDAYEAENGKKKKSYSLAMGCQMNAHDSEKLEGMLTEMGYERTEAEKEADFIIYNTCCVRENAELKVYGKLGWLKHYKETKNPNAMIALCGCMMQQKGMGEQILRQYPFVDLAFGTHNLYRFAQLMLQAVKSRRRVVEVIQEEEGSIPEDLPVRRSSPYHAYITIMYGCNNFCSYCSMSAAESALAPPAAFWRKHVSSRRTA